MDSDDRVDPADAALQSLLAELAARANDSETRDKLLDFRVMAPPLQQWPVDALERLLDVCRVAVGHGFRERG